MTSPAGILTTFSLEALTSVHAMSTAEPDYSEYEDQMCDRASVRDFRRLYEPPLFWAITLVGGVGNLAVVWIYLYFQRRLKTMTDVYLLNLAVADLLFLVTLPLWAAEAVQGWNFNSGLCKLNSALYKVNLFSSMFLLTCISVDRYVVIVQTTKAQNTRLERRRCSRLVCLVVWVMALLLALPEFIFSTPMPIEGVLYCRKVYPADMGNVTKIALLSLQVAMGFCLPFIILAFCYSVIGATLLKTRNFQKHKAMRVILVVVVVFVASQLPYNAVLVVEAADAHNITLTDCGQLQRFDIIGQVLKSLAYTHACLNPFVYVFVGVRFRRDVMQLLRCFHCRRPVTKSLSLKSSRSPLSSARTSVMSDCETSQALSL